MISIKKDIVSTISPIHFSTNIPPPLPYTVSDTVNTLISLQDSLTRHIFPASSSSVSL